MTQLVLGYLSPSSVGDSSTITSMVSVAFNTFA